jgi:hypothetical protein
VSIVLAFLSLMALLSYTGNYDSKQQSVDNAEPFCK